MRLALIVVAMAERERVRCRLRRQSDWVPAENGGFGAGETGLDGLRAADGRVLWAGFVGALESTAGVLCCLVCWCAGCAVAVTGCGARLAVEQKSGTMCSKPFSS